ncbi:MAG: hypothetical protein ACR2IV_15045 [Bryobacteraceae bacterium]
MDQQTLLTIFVIVAAVALVIQAGMLIGLFVVARGLQAKVTAILPDVQNVIGISKRTLESVEKHVNKIGTTSGAILDVTKQQLAKVDDLLTDATTRAKVQMERAEMVLDDAMTRTQQTVSLVQRGVVRPVREVYGVFAGIRTTLSHLGRSGRPTVDHATSDEEMFI